MRVFIYTSLIILYIFHQFFLTSYLKFGIGIIALIALILSLFYAKGIYLKTGCIFLILGTGLFIYNGFPLYTYLFHFERMLGLLSLYMVLPFINSVIKVGHYDKSLSTLLQNGATSLHEFYKRSFVVCNFLTLFLNIAVLPLLHKTLRITLDQFPLKIQNKYYAQNLLRAYALSLTWSPMELLISTSIDITHIKYYQVFPILLSLMFFMAGIDWFLSSFKYRKVNLTSTVQTKINQKDSSGGLKRVYKKVFEMSCMLFVFIILVSLVEHSLKKPFLFSVVLTMIPVTLIWVFLIGRIKRFCLITLPFWKERVTGLSNFFFMFLCAGFFVDILAESGVLSLIEPIFTVASKYTFLLYLLIAGFFTLATLIGFHTLVSMTFLAELIKPLLPTLAPIPLSIVLIACSVATIMFSPFNMSVSLLADQLKANPFKIGSFNFGFALFYMLLTISVAYFLGTIL
ncbi:MAG: hypothetical protein M0T74_12030 [Desulfitobacterium hafniense]|nr:hypothetical protein [Desulfitobacterium hafniense]